MNEKWAVVLIGLACTLVPEAAPSPDDSDASAGGFHFATQNDARIGEAENEERSAIREAELSRRSIEGRISSQEAVRSTRMDFRRLRAARRHRFSTQRIHADAVRPPRSRTAAHRRRDDGCTESRDGRHSGSRGSQRPLRRTRAGQRSALAGSFEKRGRQRRSDHLIDDRAAAGRTRATYRRKLRVRLAAGQLKKRIVSLESRESTLDGQLHLWTGLQSIKHCNSRPRISQRPRSGPFPNSLPWPPRAMWISKRPNFEERQRVENVASQRGRYWPTIDFIGNYALFGRFNNFDPFFAQFQRNSVNVGVKRKCRIFTSQTGAADRAGPSQLLETRAAIQRQRDQLRDGGPASWRSSCGKPKLSVRLRSSIWRSRRKRVRLADARPPKGEPIVSIASRAAVVEEARAVGRLLSGWLGTPEAQLELRTRHMASSVDRFLEEGVLCA